MSHCDASERGNLLFLGLHPRVGKNKNNHPHEIKGFLQRLEEQSWWLVLWVGLCGSAGLELGAFRHSSRPCRKGGNTELTCASKRYWTNTAPCVSGGPPVWLLDTRQGRWKRRRVSAWPHKSMEPGDGSLHWVTHQENEGNVEHVVETQQICLWNDWMNCLPVVSLWEFCISPRPLFSGPQSPLQQRPESSCTPIQTSVE